MGKSSSASKEQSFDCTWTVQLHNAWRGHSNEPLLSPTFPNLPNSKLTWRMRLVVNNSDEMYKDHCSLFLILVSSDKSEVRAKFKFQIFSSSGLKPFKLYSERCSFYLRRHSKLKCFREFNRLDFHKDCVKEHDSLIIVCDVFVSPDSDTTAPILIHVPHCSLSDDYGQLFENQNLSDVTMSVNDTEFKVHSVILAARSPVFAAMFKHDMKERNTGIVKVDDIDQGVMKEVLRFVYTGKVLNLDEMADSLLAAAEKYQLIRLKAMCEKTLLENLSIQNASDMLVFADLHKADQLKTQIIDFINANAKDVIKTAKFKTLMDTHSRLIAEVFVASVAQ